MSERADRHLRGHYDRVLPARGEVAWDGFGLLLLHQMDHPLQRHRNTEDGRDREGGREGGADHKD
jgi:hypothetical protein